MSTFQKSYRRPTHGERNQSKPDQNNPDNFVVDAKHRTGVSKLRELFPNWSEQDLQSVLVEVSGDVETAVTRISEGHAEQWGNVQRKKDKKVGASGNQSPNLGTNSPTFSNSSPPRGGRGGQRGGRGGMVSSRGGRGGAHGLSRSNTPRERDRLANGHSASGTPANDDTAATAVSSPPLAEGWSSPDPATSGETTTGWGGATTDWGADTNTVDSKPTETATTTEGWGASPPPAPPAAKINGAASIKSTPGAVGGKLSWAQIARPQEKPKPPPAPVEEPIQETPAAHTEIDAPPEPSLEPEPLTSQEFSEWEEPTTVQPPTWDDETPLDGQARVSTPSHTTADKSSEPSGVHVDADGWITNAKDESSAHSPPGLPSLTPSTSFATSAATASAQETPATTASPAPSASSPARVAASASSKPSSRANNRFKPEQAQAVVMPSSFGPLGLGGPSMGGSDLGFGRIGTASSSTGLGSGSHNSGLGIGSMGMQFGSLSIGGVDDNDMPNFGSEEPETNVQSQAPAPSPPKVNQPTPPPAAPTVQPHSTSTTVSPLTQQQPTLHSSTAPSPLASLNMSNFFQPQPQPQPSSVQTQPQSQTVPAATSAGSTPFGSFNPLGQQSLHTPTHQTQTQPQASTPAAAAAPPTNSIAHQHHPQQPHMTLASYANHSLPSHVESHTPPAHTPQQQQPTQTQPASQGMGLGSASYYRQQDYGYTPSSHTPQSLLSQQQQQQQTQHAAGAAGPEAGLSGVGGSGAAGGYTPFSNLASNLQNSQTSNPALSLMGNYNSAPEFNSYGDQRGLYDGYGQQGGFGSRNFLGQDDLGKLAQGNQQPLSAGLSMSAAAAAAAAHQPQSIQPQQPGSQTQTTQSGTPDQTQQSQQQQPQQQPGYPGVPPVPYFYNPYYQQPHNPYYTAGPPPNPAYGIGQPFMKYPMYPGQGVPPAGPGTPTGQAGKVVHQNVNVPQPLPGSYGHSHSHSGLYGQGGYDDVSTGYPQHQHQQGSLGGEYGKQAPLYGLSQHQTLLAQSRAAQQSQQAAQGQSQGGVGSDNPYKAYGAKAGAGGGNDPSGASANAANPGLHRATQPSYATGAGGRFGNVTGPPGVAGSAQGQGGQQAQGQGSYPQQGDSGNYYQQYQRPQYWQ